MILLITFLQDVIQPQILPKLLSDEKNCINNYAIQYGKNFSAKDKYNRHIPGVNKNINSFIKNIKTEISQIPSFFFKDKQNLTEICKEKTEKLEKNELSCIEIFLSFLEFVIYYFKYDAVYVNCSIENEGFEPIKNITNFDDKNEKNKKDERFYDYFKFRYCKQRNYNDKTKTRDGLILIRDPFDPHYNPGQSLRKGNLNTFIENLKFGYLSLIKNGNFKRLRKDFIDKECYEKQKN